MKQKANNLNIVFLTMKKILLLKNKREFFKIPFFISEVCFHKHKHDTIVMFLKHFIPLLKYHIKNTNHTKPTVALIIVTKSRNFTEIYVIADTTIIGK